MAEHLGERSDVAVLTELCSGKNDGIRHPFQGARRLVSPLTLRATYCIWSSELSRRHQIVALIEL